MPARERDSAAEQLPGLAHGLGHCFIQAVPAHDLLQVLPQRYPLSASVVAPNIYRVFFIDIADDRAPREYDHGRLLNLATIHGAHVPANINNNVLA